MCCTGFIAHFSLDSFVCGISMGRTFPDPAVIAKIIKWQFPVPKKCMGQDRPRLLNQKLHLQMVGPRLMIFGCAKSSDLHRWESTIVGAEKIGIDWWPNCSFMRWAHQRELKKSILPLWWKLKKPFHLCFMFQNFNLCFSLYVEPAPETKKQNSSGVFRNSSNSCFLSSRLVCYHQFDHEFL